MQFQLNNIQPAFTKQKIVILGSGFIKNNMYYIKIMDLYNGDIVAEIKTNEITLENKIVQQIGNAAWIKAVTPGNFYKIQLLSLDKSVCSNVAVGKLICEPSLNITPLNSGVSVHEIKALDSDKIETCQITFKHNNKILDKSDMLLSNIEESIDFVSPYYFQVTQGASGLETTVIVDYKTSNGYEGTKTENIFIKFQTLQSVITNYSYYMNHKLEIFIKSPLDTSFRKIGYYNSNLGQVVFDSTKIINVYKQLPQIDKYYSHWIPLSNFSDNIVNFMDFNNYYVIDSNQNAMILEKLQFGFDSMFLQDKDSIYAIDFNPKLSGLKEVTQETKVDTLGSKYPYVFRNGMVQYKEFQLSGLISCIMNSSIKKYTAMPVQRTLDSSFQDINFTNLNNSNIVSELQYRQDFIAWLTNGEIKIFRSPTEGILLIRILNVQLTPQQTLGRMLYDFSCQAIEIDQYTYKNLLKYHLIQGDE